MSLGDTKVNFFLAVGLKHLGHQKKSLSHPETARTKLCDSLIQRKCFAELRDFLAERHSDPLVSLIIR